MDYITAKEIYDLLSAGVFGQDEANKAISSAVARHLFCTSDHYKGEYQKNNVLIIGKSSTGKTQLMRQLRRTQSQWSSDSIPLISFDASKLVGTGFRGVSVEDILVQLHIADAEKFLHWTERGIVHLDEIDKLITAEASEFPTGALDNVAKFTQDVLDGKTATTVKTKARGKAVVKGGKNAARDTTSLLSSMLTFAVKEGYIESNVAIGVSKPTTDKVERFLSEEELSRLGLELANDKYPPHARNIIRLLLLTGCRRNEISTLQWDFIDSERMCIRLPKAKTGARAVPLGEVALEFIQTLERTDSCFVFPSSQPDKPYSGTNKIWGHIKKNAEIENCRIHDLRHSFASICAEIGIKMATISVLLGHSTGRGTTSRYVHFGLSSLGKAASKACKTINDRLNAKVKND